MLDFLCKFSVILPPAGLCLLLLIACRRGKARAESLFPATVAWGVLVTILTESLTLARGLTRGRLILPWLLIDILLLIYLKRMPAVTVAGDVSAKRAAEGQESSFSRFAKLLIALILSLIGVTALVAPPNSTDALNYHLPRIIFWLQNGSVAFYPTDDSRQLLQPPGAEYLILQFHALWGGDRFDNLVQWGAFLLCVIGVTQLARQLGAGKRAQLVAAVFCATLPQAILQASGANNDLVVSWWLIAACYYMLEFARRPHPFVMTGLGAAAGLAVLTKGTAYFFLPTLGMVLTFAWSRQSWLAALRFAPLGLVLLLMLNIGHWRRSYQLTGAPVQPVAVVYQKEYSLNNDKVTLASTASNMLRNVALHLQFPDAGLTRQAERAIKRAIAWLGEEPNDPAMIWRDTKFVIPSLSRYESTAGNPWHLGVILLTMPMWWITRKTRNRSVILIVLGLIAGFVLFCSILRWQPWHSRLHLPLFIIWSAPVGIALSHWSERAVAILCVLFLLLSLPWVMANENRSVSPWAANSILTRSRIDLYFARRAMKKEPFIAAAESIRSNGCRQVAIQPAEAGDEYLMLNLLLADSPDRQVRHIGVRSASARLAVDGTGLKPCVIICQSCAPEQIDFWRVRSNSVRQYAELTLFEMPAYFTGSPKRER